MRPSFALPPSSSSSSSSPPAPFSFSSHSFAQPSLPSQHNLRSLASISSFPSAALSSSSSSPPPPSSSSSSSSLLQRSNAASSPSISQQRSTETTPARSDSHALALAPSSSSPSSSFSSSSSSSSLSSRLQHRVLTESWLEFNEPALRTRLCSTSNGMHLFVLRGSRLFLIALGGRRRARRGAEEEEAEEQVEEEEEEQRRARAEIELECDPPLPSDSHTLLLQPQARHLAIVGLHSLTVVKLPRSLSSSSSSSSSSSKLLCSSYAIAERLFRSDKRESVRPVQAAFHPCSPHHLLVLSSDSVLRLYDLSSDLDEPEQLFSLSSFAHTHAASAFVFGPSCAFERFSCIVSLANGDLLVICPIVPWRVAASAQIVRELRACVEEEQQAIAADEAREAEKRKRRSQNEARLAWLHECWRPQEVARAVGTPSSSSLSSSSKVEAFISQSTHFVPAVQLVTNSGSRASRLAGHVTQFLSLSSSSFPMRLIRVFSRGRVDVLISVAPLLPAFLDRQEFMPPPEAAIIAIDTITLPMSSSPSSSSSSSSSSALVPYSTAADSCDILALSSPQGLSDVVLMTRDSIHLLVLPYLDRLTQAFQSNAPIDEIQRLMKDAEGAIVRLDSTSSSSSVDRSSFQPSAEGSFVTGSVVDHPVEGRFLIVVNEEGRLVLRSLHRQVSAVRKLFAKPSTQQRSSAETSSSPSFNVVVERARSKLRAKNLLTAMPPPSALHDVKDLKCVKSILVFKEALNEKVQDLRSLHLSSQNKLASLHGRCTTVDDARVALEQDVEQCRANHARLSEQIKLHCSVQEKLVLRVQKLSLRAASINDIVSDAEAAFIQSTKEKKIEVEQLAHSIQDMSGRAAQLRLYLEDRTQPALPSSEDASLRRVMSSGRLQTIVKTQTEELAHLIDRVKQLKTLVASA